LEENCITSLEPLKECGSLRSFTYSEMEEQEEGVRDFSPLLSLPELSSIHISNVSLDNLSVFSRIKKLKSLTLNGTGLRDISVLAEFPVLESVDLSFNPIRDISCLSGVTNLKSLSLNDTDITDIEVLRQFPGLKKLEVSNTRVRDFNVVKNLTALEIFKCAETEQEDFTFLQVCTHLKELDLSINKLQDISFIAGLPYVEKLNLKENQISDINSLNSLIHLKELDLSDNKIRNIDAIENLASLTTLNLANNHIVNIKPLNKLIFLERLMIDSNEIEDISSLAGMKSLFLLHLSENRITDIEVIRNLTSLNYLTLSDNQITDISVLKNLSLLEWLQIARNKISDIEPLRELSSLSYINLQNNLITSLPLWAMDYTISTRKGDIITNNEIQLAGNPFFDPPLEIIEMGKGAILRYLKKKKTEKFSALKEAKLILVGDGAGGKTSLRERLLDTKAPLPALDKRTRGIDVCDWNIRRGFVAHIWDFGGQDVYYPVHRFFLTENAVFVLLASTRNEAHNFEYWIPTIFQFGGKSPIIIGQTSHEGNVVAWNDLGRYIRHDDFNIIRTVEGNNYFELNLPRRNAGLKAIREEIIHQLTRLPHCRKNVPVSWIKVREELKEWGEEYSSISFDTFESICNRLAPDSFISYVDHQDCARFLHRIGSILWYSGNPVLQDWVILQPNWAVEAVYKIIDDPIIQDNRGHIRAKDFTRLWKGKAYARKHDLLKQMLVVFRVAFPKKHKEEEFIMPARLISCPGEKRWKENECLWIEYVYDFMPRGLLNQLSAELSRYIPVDSEGVEEVWNNVVNFSHANASYQMEEDFYKRKIILRANGKNARGLVMVIMHTLDQINAYYKGITPEITVPCICRECRKRGEGTRFKYSKLLEWEASNRKYVYCNESEEQILIDKLLYDAGLAAPVHVPATIKNSVREVRIFLASSSELEIERKEFEIFINRENKEWIKKGIFFRLEVWEDFIDHISSTRLQDEYNEAINDSHIFVSLFWTKVGKYTEEEFRKAYGNFIRYESPLVYTYFKTSAIPMNQIKRDDFLSLDNFKKQLQEIEHYPTYFDTSECLQLHFKQQLDKLISSGEL